MAIERRGFLKRIAGFALAGLLLQPGNANHSGGGRNPAGLPIGIVEAVRANSYPGPKKRLNPADIAKPGQWAG